MYFPGLTLEIAEAIVSPIIDEREWIFDSSHPLVLAYENLRKVEKRVLGLAGICQKN